MLDEQLVQRGTKNILKSFESYELLKEGKEFTFKSRQETGENVRRNSSLPPIFPRSQ